MKGQETTVKSTASKPSTEIDSLKKTKESKKGKRGGRRENSGRKTSEEKLVVLGLQQQIDQHANQEVEVIEKKGEKTTIVKKTRTVALLDVLYTEGHNKKNIPAIKEYLDRTMGKAKQPIEHSGQIDQAEQRVPSKKEIEAEKAYRKVLHGV